MNKTEYSFLEIFKVVKQLFIGILWNNVSEKFLKIRRKELAMEFFLTIDFSPSFLQLYLKKYLSCERCFSVNFAKISRKAFYRTFPGCCTIW